MVKWNSFAKKAKRELWEQNKTPYQRFKINASVTWRRFMTQTHGMGYLFVMFFIMFVIISVLPIIGDSIMSNLNKSKYHDALVNGCKDKTFYAWNWKACADIEVMPSG